MEELQEPTTSKRSFKDIIHWSKVFWYVYGAITGVVLLVVTSYLADITPMRNNQDNNQAILATTQTPVPQNAVISVKGEGIVGVAIIDPVTIQAKNSPYILEGAVPPEATKLTITHKGNEMDIPGYGAGDTEWSISLSEENGLLEAGGNQYTLKAYRDDGSLILNHGNKEALRVFLEYAVYLGEVEEQANIAVRWLPEPLEVSVEQVLTDELVPEEGAGTTWEVENREQYRERFEILKVGTVTSAAYANHEILLLHKTGDFHGITHSYRVMRNPVDNQLVLLTTISPAPDLDDRKLFWKADGIDIPSLHLPERVAFQGGTLIAEEFSPDDFFSHFSTTYTYGEEAQDYKEVDKPWKEVGTHPQLGTVYEDENAGYFVVKNPDHSVRLYQFELPGEKLEREDKYTRYLGDPIQLDMQLTSGGTHSQKYVFSPNAICPPRGYNIYRLTQQEASQRLQAVGTMAGQTFYAPVAQDDELYKQAEENRLLSKQVYDSDGNKLDYTEDEYYNNYPFLLWQDSLGRWVGYFNTEFVVGAEAGCSYRNTPIEAS